MQEQLNKQEASLKPPSMYHVVMYNDDFTPFEFVTNTLIEVLGATPERANSLAAAIHSSGKAVVGTFTQDISETKANTCISLALAAQYPLKTEAISAE